MQLIHRHWLQFSLRTLFVLISVTALVVGIFWNIYRDNRDYENRRDHWLSIGYKLEVEETPVWFGLHTRRKIVGLWTDDLSPYYHSNRISFGDVQQLQDLRRISILENSLPDEACAEIAKLAHVEKLAFFDSHITNTSIEKLSHLPKLTSLELAQTWELEKDGIPFFNQFSALQELSLNSCIHLAENIDQLRIPSLRELDISACHFERLDLSKNGFGGMPQLEVLIARECGIQKIIFDDSKLKLRRLDLRVNKLTRLDGLAAAAPELEVLLIDEDDLNPELIDDLRQLKNLTYLIIGAGHQITATYFGNRTLVKDQLPSIATNFEFHVLLENAPFTKSPSKLTFRLPADFDAELPFVQAGK